MDGSVVDVGSAFDRPLTAGPRRIQVRAPGYAALHVALAGPSEEELVLRLPLLAYLE